MREYGNTGRDHAGRPALFSYSHILVFSHSKLLLIGLLGFFSGLPLALTASTLSAWLADAHVDRAAIGLFAAIATPYALKFLWAPLLDGLPLPLLTARFGRRRGWLLLTQCLLALSIAAMAFTNPAISPWMTALVGVAVATLSATQDTIIDAYRVELLAPEQQGSGAAWATFGYRIGMLASGGGALALAQWFGWETSYLAMGGIMGLGILVTLMGKEKRIRECANTGIREKETQEAPLPVFAYSRIRVFLTTYVIDPFRDFMTRPHWFAVLAFVVLYKLGDAFMGVMLNPFLLDLGFTKIQIATVVKSYGLLATILGAFAGGWMVERMGMFRTLLLCGGLHMATNLLLVVQAHLGPDVHFLALSISLENFTGGMATAAFVAYLSALCRLNYTATQYALLSSLAAFGRTWLSTPSGALAQALGWPVFFAIASLMAIPGLVLLVWLERRRIDKSATA